MFLTKQDQLWMQNLSNKVELDSINDYLQFLDKYMVELDEFTMESSICLLKSTSRF